MKLYFPTHKDSGLFNCVTTNNTLSLKTGWSYVKVPASLGNFDFNSVPRRGEILEWCKLENGKVREATAEEIYQFNSSYEIWSNYQTIPTRTMTENPMKNIGPDGKVFELYERTEWGKVVMGSVLFAVIVYLFFVLCGVAFGKSMPAPISIDPAPVEPEPTVVTPSAPAAAPVAERVGRSNTGLGCCYTPPIDWASMKGTKEVSCPVWIGNGGKCLDISETEWYLSGARELAKKLQAEGVLSKFPMWQKYL